MGKQKKYWVKDILDGKLYCWTVKEILENINRNRSSEWKENSGMMTDYDESDWQEGLEQWTEFELLGEE